MINAPNTTVREVLQSGSAAFGTSGLRGLVDDLTYDVVSAVVGGFVDLLLETKTNSALKPVLLGHDLRPSSPDIVAMVAEVLQACGLDIVFAGAVPTPALALVAKTQGRACIMVTGSHLPFDRNGIKFYLPSGEITKCDERAMLDAQAKSGMHFDKRSLPTPDGSIADEYVTRFVTHFDGLLTNKRIGLYQHSAVGRDLCVRIFERLGATVAPLARSDQFVPIDTEAVDDADIQQCRSWVEEHHLDAVFSTDGDGDPPLLADNTGTYFRGDVLGILAAKYLEIDALATPVSSNTAAEKSGWFDHVVRTKIGSPYVLAAMANLQREHPQATVAGFEPNGGFLTQTDIQLPTGVLCALPTRDALLPALATLALAKRRNMQLSDIASLLPQRVTVSGRLQNRPVDRSLAFLNELERDSETLETLLGALGPVNEVDKTDGLRMTTAAQEVVHLRPSGNAPEFRIYVEAQSAARADAILQQMVERLSHVLPKD